MAETYVFTPQSGADPSWGKPSNWVPYGIPKEADKAIIPSGTFCSINAYQKIYDVEIYGSVTITRHGWLFVFGPKMTLNGIVIFDRSGMSFSSTTVDGKGTFYASKMTDNSYHGILVCRVPNSYLHVGPKIKIRGSFDIGIDISLEGKVVAHSGDTIEVGTSTWQCSQGGPHITGPGKFVARNNSTINFNAVSLAQNQNKPLRFDIAGGTIDVKGGCTCAQQEDEKSDCEERCDGQATIVLSNCTMANVKIDAERDGILQVQVPFTTFGQTNFYSGSTINLKGEKAHFGTVKKSLALRR